MAKRGFHEGQKSSVALWAELVLRTMQSGS